MFRMTRELSIVIPIFNEKQNIELLASEIESVFLKERFRYEVIWVDDSSTDESYQVLLTLNRKVHRVLRHDTNRGQSAALMTGILAARAEVIATIDGDLQNDPNDLFPLLVKLGEGFDVVCGFRKYRKDAFLRTYLSKFANIIANRVTGVPVSDLGCTLRVFRKSLINDLEIIGEMHRVFVIYLFFNGAKISQIEVNHRNRIYGETKYGYSRILKFLMDVLLAIFYSKFRFRPLYYFGTMALGTFIIGSLMQIVAVMLRVLDVKPYIDTTLITGGLLLQISSFSYLSFGLIAELLARFPSRK